MRYPSFCRCFWNTNFIPIKWETLHVIPLPQQSKYHNRIFLAISQKSSPRLISLLCFLPHGFFRLEAATRQQAGACKVLRTLIPCSEFSSTIVFRQRLVYAPFPIFVCLQDLYNIDNSIRRWKRACNVFHTSCYASFCCPCLTLAISGVYWVRKETQAERVIWCKKCSVVSLHSQRFNVPVTLPPA